MGAEDELFFVQGEVAACGDPTRRSTRASTTNRRGRQQPPGSSHLRCLEAAPWPLDILGRPHPALPLPSSSAMALAFSAYVGVEQRERAFCRGQNLLHVLWLPPSAQPGAQMAWWKVPSFRRSILHRERL